MRALDSLIKNLPAMQETQVQSPGRDDPLEKGMATNPVFLPEEFHGQRSLAGYIVNRVTESDRTEQLTPFHFFFFQCRACL